MTVVDMSLDLNDGVDERSKRAEQQDEAVELLKYYESDEDGVVRSQMEQKQTMSLDEDVSRPDLDPCLLSPGRAKASEDQ
ncbi:hypothetical protein E4U19_002821 [Claviceps sp. Clav32 group G5]|nr:hypothetical protein E4U19_002821 [Claviceps sp. Clav32 group G5]